MPTRIANALSFPVQGTTWGHTVHSILPSENTREHQSDVQVVGSHLITGFLLLSHAL